MGEHIFHLQHRIGRRESDKNKCPILSFVFIFLAGIFSLKPIQNRILEVTHRSFAHPPPPPLPEKERWAISQERLHFALLQREANYLQMPQWTVWYWQARYCDWERRLGSMKRQTLIVQVINKVNKNSQKETLRKSLVQQYLSKLPSSAPNLPRLKPRPLRKV